MFLLTWSGSAETRKKIFTVRLKEAELVVYFTVHLSSLFFFLNDLMKLICIGCYYCCNCLHLEFKRTFILKRVLRQIVKKAKGFATIRIRCKGKNYKWFNWEVIFL